MTTQSYAADKPKFLIRVSEYAEDSVVRDSICRAIERLGGRKTSYGSYSFPTRERRAAAIDLLADSFGARYVETFENGNGGN